MTKKVNKNKKISPKRERKLNLPTPKVKNTSGYYLCMGNNCHGQNITQVAKDCRTNAPALNAQRVKKIKELAKAAKIIGRFAQDLEKVLPH
jgi:ribosomal protein S6